MTQTLTEIARGLAEECHCQYCDPKLTHKCVRDIEDNAGFILEELEKAEARGRAQVPSGMMLPWTNGSGA